MDGGSGVNNSMAYRQGMVAEYAFMSKIMSKGFDILTPVSPDAKYDTILYKNGRYIKIQVKSTTLIANSKYSAGIAYGTKTKDQYSSDDVDFFAIYLVPEEVWYIIPHYATNNRKRLKLSADGSCKLGSFRENWEFNEAI